MQPEIKTTVEQTDAGKVETGAKIHQNAGNEVRDNQNFLGEDPELPHLMYLLSFVNETFSRDRSHSLWL